MITGMQCTDLAAIRISQTLAAVQLSFGEAKILRLRLANANASWPQHEKTRGLKKVKTPEILTIGNSMLQAQITQQAQEIEDSKAQASPVTNDHGTKCHAK